jgi:hypothetical protein
VGVLLVQIRAILPQLADFVTPFIIELADLPLLVLKRANQLLVLSDENLLALLRHL